MSNYSKCFLLILMLQLLSALTNSVLGQCPGTGCTYTITGTDNGTYTVSVGEKICLDPGADFTGTIDLNDGELINCATNPQTFTFIGGPFGVINNYGIIHVPSGHSFTSGLTFNNYQTINHSDNLTVQVGAIFNNFGDAYIDGTLLNRDQINNSGNITVVGPLSENTCLLYTSPSPRDLSTSRMPSSA